MEWPKTDSCAGRVVVGFGLGAGLGSSIGACYGTFEAFRYKIPGLFKIRYIGQTTVSSGLAFGVFLAAGALLHCDRVQ